MQRPPSQQIRAQVRFTPYPFEDVAALVREASEGHSQITGFRVVQSASFHDWLITHLSMTLVRMKTVEIEGQLVRN